MGGGELYKSQSLQNSQDLANPLALKSLKESFAKFYSTKNGSKIPYKNISQNLNIDVLMETGTGKTFTYLNLIFALNKRFNQNKFIIFVPRKAILESVRENVKLTRNYFYKEYKKELTIYTYEGAKSVSNLINGYIKNDDELSVLVLTNSSMDKKANILNQNKSEKKENILNRGDERLFNTKSIMQNIAELTPICIIDEPHLLKGKAFMNAFSEIYPLYFRFGATFPKEQGLELSNLIYALDSINAFKNYLVKQIRVSSISADSKPFLIFADRNCAKFAFFKAGVKQEAIFKKDDDLGSLDANLMGVSINKISKDKVYLSNGTTLQREESYRLNESEISDLLKASIDLHFEKEERNFKQNIKTLSLFFMPEIKDFRAENPFIKNEFERIYKEKRAEILKKSNLDEKYRAFLQRDFDKENNLLVHQGYFSGDSVKKNAEDIEAQGIRLILQDKVKLLSFDYPLRFIFSVWALQEGWDNPNIFTICKLAYTKSDISRHQQVGRGLRLPVDIFGRRFTLPYLSGDEEIFYSINYLDMLTSGAEIDFIESLQKEIADSSLFSLEILDANHLENLGLNERQRSRLTTYLEDLGAISYDEANNGYKITAPIAELMKDNDDIKNLLGDKFDALLDSFSLHKNKHEQIINANDKKQKIKIRKKLALEFQDLWRTINQKARIVYKNINEKVLLEAIARDFNALKIPKKQIMLDRKRLCAKTNSIITEQIKSIREQDFSHALKKQMPSLLLDLSKDLNLPLAFVLEIYNALDKQSFLNDPAFALERLKVIIKEALHKNLLYAISYDFNEKCFCPSYFMLFDENLKPRDNIEGHLLGRFESSKLVSNRYLYEKGIYDSLIEEEAIKENIELVEDLQIQVFAKLPKFKIPTPYKDYEPDFAYLLKDKNGKKIFFVCETKGYEKQEDIDINERKKIDYAKVFFANLQNQLKDVRVCFETRLNKQSLSQILSQILKEQK